MASKVGSVGSVPITVNPALHPAFNASFSGLFKSFFDVLPEETLSEMPVPIVATGGTERQSLVLEHPLRPMFSYLHAIVAPTDVYAAIEDFGAQHGSVGLTERITKAAVDFTRLRQACGPRVRRDVFTEELTEMNNCSPERPDPATKRETSRIDPETGRSYVCDTD